MKNKPKKNILTHFYQDPVWLYNIVIFYSVAVIDEKSLEAVLQVVLVVCSGCNNHGTCDYTNIRAVSDIYDTSRYATCNCDSYWDG